MANIEPTPNEHYEVQSERKYGEFATKFQFGSNPSAEIWNGRLAMVGFLGALVIELTTGQGFFHWLGIASFNLLIFSDKFGLSPVLHRVF